MKKKTLLLVVLCLMMTDCLWAQNRGLYIWATASFINNNAQRNRVINACIEHNIKDVYLYAYPTVLTGYTAGIRAFISKAGCYEIRVWSMDGDREYFSDHPTRGNPEYYDYINGVIAYNASSAASERFVGINIDLEPHDQGPVIGPPYSFHNDITDSDLSTVPGSGVWQSTEKLDREMLMRNWLLMTETGNNMAHANGLLFSASMVNWLDDYYGEPVRCTYNGVTQGVMEHMMNYMDDYFIMSYNTTTNGIRNRMLGELAYANTLPAGSRPRIWGGVETHNIGNATVSYYNHATKNSKPAVVADLATVEGMVSGNASYYGMNIHDWINGWRDLPPVSNNTADPGACTLPVSLISFEAANDGNWNILEWKTSEEIDNDRFEIEYSYDGITFEWLSTIKGNVNSNTLQHYEYKHELSKASHVYYRLKQVDLDGAFTHSKIIQVKMKADMNVFLFPSPAQNVLNVVIPDVFDRDKILVKVVDMKGSECLTLFSFPEKTTSFTVDISSLASGMYLLQLFPEKNAPVILKFEKR